MIKRISGYLSAAYLSAVFPFVVQPLVAAKLTPEEYSNFALISTYIALGVAFNFGISGKLLDAKNSASDLLQQNSVNLVLSFALTAFNTLALVLIGVFYLNQKLSAAFCIALFVGVYSAASLESHFTYLQIERKDKYVNYISISQSALLSLLTLILIIHYNLSFFGREIAIVVTGILVISFIISQKQHLPLIDVDKNLIIKTGAFAIHSAPHKLSSIALMHFPKISFLYFGFQNEFGFYSYAMFYVSLILLAFEALNKSFIGYYRKSAEISLSALKIAYIRISAITVAVCAISALLFYWLLAFVFLLDNSEVARGARQYTPFLIFAAISLGIYYPAASVMMILQRPLHLGFGTLISFVIMLIFLMIDIPLDYNIKIPVSQIIGYSMLALITHVQVFINLPKVIK